MDQGRLHLSSPLGKPAASSGATRAISPTTDGLFDPGASKKKRNSRPNAAMSPLGLTSATTVAISNAAPHRRPRSKAAAGTSTGVGNCRKAERNELSQSDHETTVID